MCTYIDTCVRVYIYIYTSVYPCIDMHRGKPKSRSATEHRTAASNDFEQLFRAALLDAGQL